jgi:uncharacterized protein
MDTEFQAVSTTKIGPVNAKFKAKVTLSDLDPPNGYKISGQGDGGVAGFAKGGAPKEGGTLLSYSVEAQIGGKLAQLGQRLINGAAKKMADEAACEPYPGPGDGVRKKLRKNGLTQPAGVFLSQLTS